MARVVEDLLDGALLDDPAGVHHTDAIAHRADDPQVVGDQQDRGAGLAAQLTNEIEHLGLDRGVEPRRRLVEHEQLRVPGERHRDHDALQHAARELVRVAVHDALGGGDVDPLERVDRRSLWHPSCREPEHLVRLGDLASDLQHRVHRLHRVLVHHRRVA